MSISDGLRDCSVQMYADDLKIYTVIDSAEDVTQFQRHLDALVTWSHKWQLYISSKNCNLLYCGSIDGPDVLIDGSMICKAHCVRDLGVLVDPQLKFMAHTHINSVVSRAHTRSNLILKCFVSRDRTTLVKAFTTYVIMFGR